MSELKTQANEASVEDFLNGLTDEAKRKDSLTLLEMYQRVTGEKPVMWGTSMIGFGKYHYKSDRSSQEGDWALAAFSPRKQNLTLYFTPGFSGYASDLEKLGKHKTSVGCLYIKRLSDVDLGVLEKLIRRSFQDAKKLYT